MSNPEQSDDNDPLDEILGQYMLRIDEGERVDEEQFVAQHPEVADKLRAHFANERAVQGFIETSSIEEDRDVQDPRLPSVGETVQYFGDYELLEEVGR